MELASLYTVPLTLKCR